MSDRSKPDRPAAPTILLCDDDATLRGSIAAHLKRDGYHVIEAADGAECLDLVAREGPRVLVLGLMMPKMDGLTALRTLRSHGNDLPVIVVTANGGIDSAITAIQLGAAAYLQKPFDVRELSLAIERVVADERLKREVQVLRSRLRTGYEAFVGRSEALAPLFADLQHLEDVVAPTVLITGESGTGKDVVARAIHLNGPRKDNVFVDIDCTSLPEHLAESELFGHERGAFTDAKVAKRGLLEVVAGGVLFLDEIGELGLPLQSKLLRALENRTFKRVGGLANIRLDAGIIAATNRDLKKAVLEGRFREDLYYRLNVVSLRVPALRERSDDIPLLVLHFLARLNQQFGRAIAGVDPRAMALMRAYPWPGNVRELKNVLERIAILGAPSHIRVEDLPAEVRFAEHAAPSANGSPFLLPLPEAGIDLDRVERELVVQALERSRGNQTAAARLLGLTRYQLRSRAEKYSLKG